MNFLNFLKSTFSSVDSETEVVKSMWRNNMWVMSPKGVGIIFKLGDQCEVHLVNSDGTTKESVLLPVLQLRQATWDEIPAARQMVTRERGLYLGYK